MKSKLAMQLGVLSITVALIGCGKSDPKSPADALPLPEGSGTQRALVLVDDSAPPPASDTTRSVTDPLSTASITRKVLRDVGNR